jgi:Ca2+-dependent lipid-binding protein
MFSRLGGSSAKAAVVSDTSPRLLFVELVEAREIMAINKNNTSDPYATLALQDLGGREIKTESFHTKQKNATIMPNWGESFTFG